MTSSVHIYYTLYIRERERERERDEREREREREREERGEIERERERERERENRSQTFRDAFTPIVLADSLQSQVQSLSDVVERI